MAEYDKIDEGFYVLYQKGGQVVEAVSQYLSENFGIINTEKNIFCEPLPGFPRFRGEIITLPSPHRKIFPVSFTVFPELTYFNSLSIEIFKNPEVFGYFDEQTERTIKEIHKLASH